MEVWRSIAGYEGFYMVSNLGRVKRIESESFSGHAYKERILKLTSKSSSGYIRVHLSRMGIAKWHSVHRLVAEAFIEKKEGCNIVNHIDNDPSNNKAENLEWTTYSGNMQHAARQGRMKYCPANLRKAQESLKKPVIAIKNGETLKFTSQSEAARTLGISRSHIAAACRKEYGYKMVGGYEWEYEDRAYQTLQKPKRTKMTESERKELQRNRMIGNQIMLGRHLSKECIEKLRRANTKTVKQFSKSDELIATYISTQEAKRATGVSHIADCCRGERKTAGGYIWRYQDE